MTTVHIIDDDEALCELLGDYLRDNGFTVITSHDGTSGLATTLREQPDLVLLDVMLPGQSGFDVLRGLRQTSHVPVLMLTARGDEIDRVLGLELGADDYVGKPFSHRELVARIQAILRRLQPQTKTNVGALSMKSESFEARYYDQPLDLTAAEFRVLNILFERAGELVDKDLISREAFGRRLQQFDRHIDIHISHIRKKMAVINPTNCIKTVRGSGYQLLTQSS
ncbi:response regulator transcription factor [Gilvimarinus polysaccharolyticus]|uniref:response regulator transcription factor n=1 Tax=Gilvimarinus polysaccharolyticus TaxID=863921 RepID=UPI00067313B8|nr:response regulator transcription factor [Gilvimarinus polysaccharolyticus]